MANEFARRLRENMTEEERILWNEPRRRQLQGQRFRRQVPLGSYVVDFACLERRFIIEVDGLQHGEPEQLAKDQARSDWLEARGFRVFRTWNGELRNNLNGAVESILGELSLLNPPMIPLPVVVARALHGEAQSEVCEAPPSGATRHLPHKWGGKEASVSPNRRRGALS